ncbi:MAG: phosphatidylglycerol lysyltransferase domain-containing protein [Acidimicrobiia bacterium]
MLRRTLRRAGLAARVHGSARRPAPRSTRRPDCAPKYLGDEAIVAVDGFTLDGRTMRQVRQAVNRTIKAGITTEVRAGRPRRRAARRAPARRGARPRRRPRRVLHGPRRPALAGRDADCVLVIAWRVRGPLAFQRYVPCRASRGLSLDAMRRDLDQDAPNGVNEQLIVDTIAWAREHGVDQISLNFAFCRALVDDDASVTGARRAQAWFVRRLSPWFQIESLLRFNAKFAPGGCPATWCTGRSPTCRPWLRPPRARRASSGAGWQ